MAVVRAVLVDACVGLLEELAHDSGFVLVILFGLHQIKFNLL
jgi:hypothetical protein